MLKFHGILAKRNRNTDVGTSQPKGPVLGSGLLVAHSRGALLHFTEQVFVWALPVVVRPGPDFVFCFPGRYASNRMGGFISLSFTLEKKKWMRSKEYLRTLPGESELEPWSGVRHLSLGGGT